MRLELGLGARQHRGPKDPSPLPTPSHTQAAPGLPHWGCLLLRSYPTGRPQGLAPTWRGIKDKSSSRCSAGTHCQTVNVAKLDLQTQLTLQWEVTARVSPGSTRRTQLATQCQHQKQKLLFQAISVLG